MEATSDYWKPVFYLLEAHGFETWLVNARDVKHLPGRPKTDKLDAVWLAKVAERQMIRPSFVPPPEIRRLRDVTRYRADLVAVRTAEKQRAEKLLEDAQIKVSVVASDIFGVSGRQMLAALIAGERDPKVLAQMAKSVLRAKIPQLEEAFSGHFGDHHAFLCRQIIDHIDHLDASIASLSAEIARRLVPFEAAITILSSITGVSRTTAEVMIAEMGVDMTRFPTAGHLCAWAGVAPGSNESAGKKRPTGTRHGSTWLQKSLIEAARAAARTKGSYFSAQYSRIARRRGPNKAAVAVAHSILAVAWHLLTNGALYDDPGARYFELRNDPAIEAKRLQRRIESLGFEVTVSEKAA
jgi:transposase